MSNKSARLDLERIYGKGCMFQKAYIAERLAQIGGIKTYKVFIKETKYKSNKINKLENMLTYHHLKHHADGGPTTIENGAIINELAHRYIHSLPREQEEIANNMLREYKYDLELKGGLIIPKEKHIELVQPFSIELDFDTIDDYIELPIYDNVFKQKYNRAEQKRQIEKYINDELDNYNL